MSKRHSTLKRFSVAFSMRFRRDVRIGVFAFSDRQAQALVEQAMDSGTAWRNTELMPILDDAWEEEPDGALHFHAEKIEGDFTPSATALEHRIRQAQQRACEALIAAYERAEFDGGSIEWEDLDEAYRLALEGRMPLDSSVESESNAD